MQLEESLTKENFWNRMMETYPVSCNNFCNWIDTYKVAVNWLELFNDGKAWAGGVTHAPKFHDLPHAFQFGIWYAYAAQLENEEWYVENLFTGYYETLQIAIEKLFEYRESWNQ